MADVLVNGFDGGRQFAQGDHETYYTREPSTELTDQQLEMVLQSELFREGLQSMVAERVPGGIANPGLSYGGSVVGPVTPVGDIHGVDTLNYTKEEKLARGKLASCYRLADINGWSQGANAYLSTRLLADNSIIIAPWGLTYDEVTAASLVKVGADGEIVDNGTTTLGVDAVAVALHRAAYSANNDITCLVHVASPPAVSISTMKCGLLPLCQEAMAIGEVGYADYAGDPDNTNAVKRSFSSQDVKVVFLRNFGVLVGGESIEEAFLSSLNVMTAVLTQMSLIPLGISNIYLPSNETRTEAYKQARELPAGTTSTRQWRYGELEFEALMRQLDNAGYRTGHIYRDQSTSYRRGRSCSEADVTQKKLSLANEFKDLSGLNLSVHRKGALAAEWVGSPNVYYREDGDQSNVNRKVTRWISETSEGEQWVSESSKLPRSNSTVKATNPNKFAPQGSNPNELKQKVKEIRKEYFEDTISAGPQSTVLEGVTWEEAQKIKDGHMTTSGIDNVLVTAASRGIIQRQHQRDALFYKNYSQVNPFDRITTDDLEAYKREVEKKSRRGYGKGAGGYTSAESESEYVPDNRPMSAPLLDQHTTYSLPPRPAYNPEPIVSSQAVSKTFAAPPSPQNDEVFRDMPRSTTMPLPKQHQLEARGTDQEQESANIPPKTTSPRPSAVPSSPVKTAQSPPVSSQPAVSPVNHDRGEYALQRTQSARYSPDKRPEIKDEFQRNVKSSQSMRHPGKKVSDNEGLRSADPASSVDGSQGGTLQKDKKKKRGFRLPSFSKKKEKH